MYHFCWKKDNQHELIESEIVKNTRFKNRFNANKQCASQAEIYILLRKLIIRCDYKDALLKALTLKGQAINALFYIVGVLYSFWT